LRLFNFTMKLDGRLTAVWLSLCLLLASFGAHAQAQPDEAMMTAVRRLTDFMRALPALHAQAFAERGVCIVENFAPFLFCGPHAALGWESGLRAHFAEDGLESLAVTFGEAQDFSVSGTRAYFSLPTTWTGLTHGRRFEEHGAWAFVLEKAPKGWRIKGYGWGVTSYREFSP
jgi:hypothetical protein